jgi:hypothetical protein
MSECLMIVWVGVCVCRGYTLPFTTSTTLGISSDCTHYLHTNSHQSIKRAFKAALIALQGITNKALVSPHTVTHSVRTVTVTVFKI